MAHSSFGFKSSKKKQKHIATVKHFTGSLALRVFLISFVCLVLPLVFYSFMMYRYDFEVKQSQEARVLELVSDIQIFMLQKLMNFEFQTLEHIAFYLTAVETSDGSKNDNITQALTKIAKIGGIDSVFVLKKNINNDAICTLSSNKDQIDHAYNSLFFTPALKDNDYALVLEDQDQKICFVKVVQRGANREVLETLNLVISTPFLIQYLTDAQGYRGVYKVFLFNQDSVIFDGQDPAFIGKKVVIDPVDLREIDGSLVLTSVPMETNTYEYERNGHRRYATVVPLAELHLNVLLTRMEIQETHYLKEFFYQTVILFVSILVLGGIGALFLTYLMAKPLNRLCAVMTQVSNNDLTIRYRPCAYGFEINKVGDMFNKMIENLLYHLHQLQEKTVKQEILQQELHIGHQIQKSLVPNDMPEVPGIEIQTVLIPAKEVGGDFYDFFINPGHPDEVVLLIADASGHGVFGCFYSLTMRSILRSLGSTMSELKEVIIKANELFCKDSGSTQVFVTTWIGSYNHKTHVLRYSSCGHPLGFVFRNQKFFKELATPGIALGVVEEIEPIIEEIQLQSGDTLFFITDGLIEARNPEGLLYGKQRFIEEVEKQCHLPIEELCEEIVHAVEHFEVDPDNQEDDLTMVIVRIR